MQIKFLKQISEPVNGEAQVSTICFSPNGQKLAMCIDRVIQLYDDLGELRDRFATKPIDSKYGRQSYVVTSMDFSPDNAMLAIAQSDNIVFVYKIGHDWGEKKSIVAKFVQNSNVTTLIWLPDGQIIFGLADGKLRSGNVKKNKSQTLFTAEQYTISLTANITKKAILSGHADGSICRFIIEDEGTGDKSGLVVRHSCPPGAIVWTPHGIIVGGCDRRIVIYNKDGKVLQQFDYSREANEREFSAGICNPTGQEVVFGSYDHIRLFSYQPRKGLFEEGPMKEIKNMYTVTSMSWRLDGSRFAIANLTGGTFLFNCSLKKQSIKGKYEINFVSLSQVLIENKSTQKRMDLVSKNGFEIVDVKILGKDRYAVGYTAHTLLLLDLDDDKQQRRCEVHWQSNGDEKFSFENENVCMIFCNGELTLIEYTGQRGILCTVRTEFLNPNLISVRIEERHMYGNKKMAYLLDSRTIAIIDLMSVSGGSLIGQIQHDSNINWLALNETSKYLLFRDKNLKLYLYNLSTSNKLCILNFCVYAQWIPDSDVVVGQSQDNLSIWYNIEHPETCDIKPIKGDVQEIIKQKNKTVVKLNDNGIQSQIELDSNKVEFNTAINDNDFRRAVAYLDACTSGTNDTNSETTNTLWETLAHLSYEKQEYLISERAYTATRQMAKARYLHMINQMAREKKNGYDNYEVRAKLAIFEKNLKTAESIYLENSDVDKAIDMYRTLHHWDEAIYVAERKHHPQADELKQIYYKWLKDTKQIARAADWKLKQHDYDEAISLYLSTNLPSKAAQIVMQNPTMMRDVDLITRIALGLVKIDMYELAGDLYEHVHEDSKALECYKAGKCFRKAVKLARKTSPGDVVKLEALWGDYLYEQMQFMEAITHFIEAGENMKAVRAAINGRQWPRALEILEQQDNDENAACYKQLAQHFAQMQEYEKAERCYVKASSPGECVEMYNRSGKWDQAYRIATKYMKKEEVAKLYSNQAKELEQKGRYKDAEKLYIIINDNSSAILMYKRIKNYEGLLRLVKQYYPDKLKETELNIAKELEQEKRFKEAEVHYVQCGEWKAAANMYRLLDQWDDAYRIARQHGGPVPAQQVAFFWAKKLGGEAGVKLLNKLGHAEQGLELACEQRIFEFAFDIARILLKEKIPEVHYKYALYLEDEHQYHEAEQEFIKAKRPRDAVLMYVQNKDWDKAQRIAQQYDKSLLNDVLIGQAKESFDRNDFPKAESFLLQAQRADLAIKLYKENGMWQDAIRVCQEYAPNKLDELREEFGKRVNDKSTGYGNDGLLEQAIKCESNGEYPRAVELYLRLTPQHDIPKETLIKAYLKASDIARKFLPENRAQQVVRTIGPRLIQLGNPNVAAEQFLQSDLYKEAVDAFVAAKQWEKAKKVAIEIDPALARYVDEEYKKHLMKHGNPTDIASIDAQAALDMYVEKNQWDECFHEAQKHGPLVLHSYIAKYAAHMIQSNRPELVANVYKKYGAIAIPQNFRIYKALFYRMLRVDSLKHENYPKWADIRDVLYDVFENMQTSTGSSSNVQREIDEQRPAFEILLWISHFYSMRCACSEHDQLDVITAKLTISLLRHSDIIPTDKAFYEAGIMCKKVQWDNMSMMFLNRYLDIVDAIEEHNLDMLATSEFVDTDIPYEIELPEQTFLPPEQHEKVKEYVLSVSMKQAIKPSLRKDSRNCVEFALTNPESGTRNSPCIITGYPVLDDSISFEKYNLMANKEDWNKFILTAKSIRHESLQDCVRFIGKWTGSVPNVSL